MPYCTGNENYTDEGFGERKTPIDFGVSRSKVKVTSTCRNRLFEQKIGFRSITSECLIALGMKIIQMKALGGRKMPIDFGVSRSKVNITSTCRNRLLKQKIGFRSITLERLDRFKPKLTR